jgi:hypothetical protein
MRKWTAILALALVCVLLSGLVASAQSANVVKNGSFEGEFINGVGENWQAFNSGGLAAYAYGPDTWERTVYDGQYSQAISISTMPYGGSDKDRYSGLYQVVEVVPGERYMFSFYGMVRSTEGTVKKSQYNYRAQIAYDFEGGSDPWSPLLEWKEMDRWPEYELSKPGQYLGYAFGVTPTTDKLTIFVRLWKKFPTPREEVVMHLDAVSLLGPAPTGKAATQPAATSGETLPATGAGRLLPLLGAALGLTAISLTGLRLARKRA